MGTFLGVLGLVALAALLLLGLWLWLDARRTVRRLDRMLSTAIDGGFGEESFDESAPSALESRMARFLNGSARSLRGVQRQRESIQRLLSDISHQTKTPVANLQLYAQLLSEQPLTPQGKDCAVAISAQSEKLQTLIEALVKTSRLETGIITTAPEPQPVGPLLEGALAVFCAVALRFDDLPADLPICGNHCVVDCRRRFRARGFECGANRLIDGFVRGRIVDLFQGQPPFEKAAVLYGKVRVAPDQ